MPVPVGCCLDVVRLIPFIYRWLRCYPVVVVVGLLLLPFGYPTFVGLVTFTLDALLLLIVADLVPGPFVTVVWFAFDSRWLLLLRYAAFVGCVYAARLVGCRLDVLHPVCWFVAVTFAFARWLQHPFVGWPRLPTGLPSRLLRLPRITRLLRCVYILFAGLRCFTLYVCVAVARTAFYALLVYVVTFTFTFGCALVGFWLFTLVYVAWFICWDVLRLPHGCVACG